VVRVCLVLFLVGLVFFVLGGVAYNYYSYQHYAALDKYPLRGSAVFFWVASVVCFVFAVVCWLRLRTQKGE